MDHTIFPYTKKCLNIVMLLLKCLEDGIDTDFVFKEQKSCSYDTTPSYDDYLEVKFNYNNVIVELSFIYSFEGFCVLLWVTSAINPFLPDIYSDTVSLPLKNPTVYIVDKLLTFINNAVGK